MNKRLTEILSILKKGQKLSRSDIRSRLESRQGKSRITLIRDLNTLVEKGIISKEGKARSTIYSIPNSNPLLSYFDLDEYFSKEIDEREINDSFDKEIFSNLRNLYSEPEIDLWEKSKQEFKKRSDILDSNIYKRELERFIVEFAWKSSQIEGNTYDLLETETLLTQNIKAKGHTDAEAIMLINHKKAFDLILNNKKSFKKISFSDVIQLHNVLMKGLVNTGLRNQPVSITGTNYRPPVFEHDLKDYLVKTIDVINATKFPPDKALIASVMIAYLQPFADGNKRTSRMLSNAILISNGYFPLSYRNVDLSEYRKAVLAFYEQNNLSNIKRITISQLKFAMENYFRV